MLAAAAAVDLRQNRLRFKPLSGGGQSLSLNDLDKRATGRVRARVVDKNTPHHLRGDAEETGAVVPVDLSLIYKPQVSLAHERRRLKRVIGALAAQIIGRQASRLIVNER